MGDYLLSGIKTDAFLSLSIHVRGTPYAPRETPWITPTRATVRSETFSLVPTLGREPFPGPVTNSII